MTTAYLLDVNVLLALSDPLHVHHATAHEWFDRVGQQAWATCALTENGYIRIASNPAYPNSPGEAGAVMRLLHQFCAHPHHTFWAADVTLREVLALNAVFTHRQVTDLYLLALAVANQGKLATFDHLIPAASIDGGTLALELLQP